MIAASAGNHAQAVAYHATKRGIAAQICMPLTTPLVKVSATRDYGAEVILVGRELRRNVPRGTAALRGAGLTFIHPFDDEAVIAGQGTLGIEMLEQHGELDALVIPVGGGGLIGGSGVRGEGDESENSGDRRADVEAAVDEGGDRAQRTGHAAAEGDDRGRNRGAMRRERSRFRS